MHIHLLSGFLGSGKTTAIQSACRILSEKGIKTGVITNDQGIRLVDAGLFKRLGIPERQVINGCFCCNYQDLDNHLQSLSETEGPEVIFAESVGSCTDIIATVLKPLRKYRPSARITLSGFADALLLHMLLVDGTLLFDENVQYIYDKQLEEAGVLVVNKIDLLNSGQLQELKKLLRQKYPDKTLLYQNSRNEESIGFWLQQLDQLSSVSVSPSMDIDYDIYGVGEARLAWLDQEMEIESEKETANLGAIHLMRDIFKRISLGNYPLGHLKFLFNGMDKISFTSTSIPEMIIETGPASRATLLLNARVQTTPEIISQLVSDAIAELEKQPGFRVRTQSVSAFQPGFPTPTYRMA